MTTADNVAQAIRGFFVNPDAYKLSAAFNRLCYGPLLGNDFDNINAGMKAVLQATPVRLFSHAQDSAASAPQHPRDRQIAFYSSYIFGDFTRVAPEQDASLAPLTVMVDRMEVSWRDCFRCIRALPVNIDPARLEAGHIRKTPDQLRYDSDHFVASTLFSLALCEILTPHFYAGDAHLRVAIPHPYGLFVGKAMPIMQTGINAFTRVHHATRPKQRGTYKQEDGNKGCATFDVAVFIDRFIAADEFDARENKVYDLLLPLLHNHL